MPDQIRISHVFTMGEGKYFLRDALTFSKEEYDLLTEEEIEALKKERHDAYKAIIDSPHTEPEKTVEEQIVNNDNDIGALELQLINLKLKKDDLKKEKEKKDK